MIGDNSREAKRAVSLPEMPPVSIGFVGRRGEDASTPRLTEPPLTQTTQEVGK